MDSQVSQLEKKRKNVVCKKFPLRWFTFQHWHPIGRPERLPQVDSITDMYKDLMIVKIMSKTGDFIITKQKDFTTSKGQAPKAPIFIPC